MSKRKRNLTREIAEELDVFNDMLSSLVELLEEKGILTYEEWEERIKKKNEEARGLVKYREVQFKE